MILDAGNGDFSLADFSPAIGIGVEQYFSYTSAQYEDVPALDLFGNPRPTPEGSMPDLGPIENSRWEPRRLVYYVDNNGNDSNDGLSIDFPLLTLAEAFNKSVVRDTIELVDGTYTGAGNRDLNFNGIDRIVRSANGAAATIIDCENLGRAFVFENGETDSTIISGITIQNGIGDNGGAVSISGAEPIFNGVVFRDNSASTSGGAVYASNSNSEFVNCVFAGNHALESGAVAISSGDVSLDFVTAVANHGDDNVSFSGDLSISNSILWNNSLVDDGVSVTYSDVMGGNNGTGNYNGRPGFVDMLNGDFHLQDWSPVIGKAGVATGVLYDIEGTVRPGTDPADMGAYESALDTANTYTHQLWYVSTTGSDSITANMGTESNPYKTIQHAVNDAIYDDEVRILPGYYDESLNNWGKDITFVGNSGVPDDVTIDGFFEITGGSPGFYDLHLTNGDGISDALQINNDATVTMYNLLITESNVGGITVNNTAIAYMNNMTIYNNATGIYDNSTGVVSVTNSILWNNTAPTFGSPTITYSDVEGGYTGTGNINADPDFIAVANGDFNLKITSPCIDAGDPASTFDNDSTVVDMGAFPLIREFLADTSTGNIIITDDESAVVTNDFTLVANDTLFVEPGADVYFNPGATLTIDGIMAASGDPGNPVSFLCSDPDATYGGVVINTGTGGRDVSNEYSYLLIQDVGAAFVPLTVNGDATLNHITIAGNENATSLEANSGTVSLNYSILEGTTSGSGTVNNVGSYFLSTNQFVDYANGDFTLISFADAIDQDTTENWIDPDYTFSDAGCLYHDQTGYASDSAVVLYPVANNTILISPDTSSTVGTGLVVQAQVFNSIGHYMTNPTVQWSNAGPQNGSFAADNTIGADLRGRVSNTFFTSTTSGDLNSISVDENTTTAQGGYFQVVPGTPDSVWVNEQTDMTMTQLDSLNFGASVFDQFSNLVSDGETVDWSVDTLQGNGDGFTFNEITSTTGNGTVTVTLATDPTGNNLSVGDQVRVQAVSGNGSHQSGLVTVIPDDIYNLTMPPELTEAQIDLSADVATIEIETALIDTFDNPLEDVEVYWEVVVGAGTGESLSNTSSFTSAEGIATITLNTSTVANSNYTVRGWVTEDALLSVLLGNQWTSQQPSAVSGVNNFLKSGKRNSGFLSPRSEIKTASLPVRIVGNSSNENTSIRENRSVYDLDDTTAIIHVIPGVTDAVLLPQDSVDVLLGDQFQIIANVLDQFGNNVADGTPVAWEIVPSNNYVTIEVAEESVTNGHATIDLLIEQNAPWDFDFVVQLTSEGVTGATGTHNINDVTPPPAVENLDISPSVWTPTNEFILAWDNPGEHSGIAGAYSRVDTETEVYEAGANISTLSILNRLPDEAASTIKVWLQDNAGNALESNAVTAIAKWDATAPAAFNVTAPLEAWYNTPTLRFEWNASSDATAGLRDYILIIDGSNTYTQHPDSTGMNIPDAFAAGTHTWSVSAFDSAGNETVTSNPQTFYVDFTNPGIAHNPVLEATENSPMTITATFSDDASGIEIAELFYRKGGEVQWQAPIDMSTLNTYQIASSFVTSVGVEYYVYSRDVAGNETYKPDAGYYSSSVTISSPGLSTTAIWPTGIPNGSSVSSYQLLSFPGQAANSTPTDILIDDLGTYDNTKWRFFEYGGSNTWTEFANISSIKPGTGYFLIVKDPSLNINTGQTRSVESDQDYQINLSSGDWIMFGNPFDFSIPLDNVYIDDTTNLVGDANLLTYDGSWTETTVIEPWTGYIYKSGTAGKIFIKPRKSNGSFAKQIVQEIVFQENEWLVDIIARNGLGMDKLNTVGVLANAMDEYDKFDAFEPPMLPGGVSLRMNNTGWAQNPDIYAKDIRSIKEEGEYWDMEVAAEDDKHNTYLYFEDIEDIPAEFDVFVIDITLGIAQDLRWSPAYRYAVINPKSIHDIRFIAGTKEFVKANNAGVDLYPERFSISQNFPNPFNPQTSILITLEDMATVDLIVYNILGEEVARILDNELRPAGYHNIIWKGLNDNGKRVASGVYFYTTRIKGTSGNMILNKTNKMIMVK
jgi:predicted outer membrane repeat protein